MSGFSITPVPQAGRRVKIKLHPEAISQLSVGETEPRLHLTRKQTPNQHFCMPVSACGCFNHHSELRTINNLKAYPDGEERGGGNFRYSEWSLPSTPHELRQRKRVATDRTRCQSFLPASRLCSHNLSGEHPPAVPRPLASSHKTQMWQHGTPRNANKHQCRIKPPKDHLAGSEKTPPKPEGTLPRAPRGALGKPPSLFAPLALLQPLLSSKATEPTPSSWGPGARFPHRRLENPQPSSPTALSAARRSPYPGARAGSPPPRARQSGCVQGAEWWGAGNSSVIISAERLLLWIVYIL